MGEMSQHSHLELERVEGHLKVIWFSTNANSSDMFTKNLMGTVFAKHSMVYVSKEVASTDSQEEGVRGSPNYRQSQVTRD
jgi:hypothetical protein